MLINITEKEYYKIFQINPHPFISKGFINLNAHKVDQIYWLVNNSNDSIGLVAGLKDGYLYSPFSAPFGGFHFNHELIYVNVINEFLIELKFFLKANAFKGIHITLPPNIYNQTINSKLINSLFYNGYLIKNLDITSWIKLESFDSEYKIKSSKEHLKQAIKYGLNFSPINADEEKNEAYDIILTNRQSKNRPINMTFEDLQKSKEIFNIDFFSVTDRNNSIIATAISYRLNESIAYLVFWGDNEKGRSLRAMDFCVFNLLNHYKQNGFKYLDIGISTENGIPNEGLLRFKETHEATSTLRHTFSFHNIEWQVKETVMSEFSKPLVMNNLANNEIVNYSPSQNLENNIAEIVPINRYGISLRLVEEGDAEFISKLRSDEKLSKFLSYTSPEIIDQVKWIQNYKTKEKAGLEYYFVALDQSGVKYGTIRLYNLDEKSFEIGSWLFQSNSPIGIAVKAHFIGFETGFEVLKAEYCKFEIRKLNSTVIKYMKDFETTLIGEDELNFYYTLSKENFYKRRSKLSIFNSSISNKRASKFEKVILLGSAGVGAAYASAKALRKYFQVKIIACDTNPSYLVSTNLFVDSYERVSPIADLNYSNEIKSIIKKHNVDTYVPFIDQEILEAAKLYESGEIEDSISLQMKESHIAEVCNDKYLSYEWLLPNGFPSPRTIRIDDKSQLLDGWILKPRKGFGSIIKKISLDSEINIESLKDSIMQEYCISPEITIDVHYSQNFNFFEYLCRERIEVKSGVCTKARLFKDPFLGEISLNLAKKLKLSSFCFQVMSLNNEYVITDINPRLGAGTAMSVAVGMDFFGAMFANLWNLDPQKYFIQFEGEKYVTRQYSEFVM